MVVSSLVCPLFEQLALLVFEGRDLFASENERKGYRTNSATRRALPLRESLWTCDLSLSLEAFLDELFDDIVEYRDSLKRS